MDRRSAIAVLAAFVAHISAWPARAQEKKRVWRVGLLSPRSRETLPESFVVPFLQGMRDRGYVEGENVHYEWRFAENDYNRLPALAADLVRLNVDVIVAATTPSVRAAQRSTKTIPIVMVSVGDPIANRLVESLARPEGNTTGVANFVGETSKKQLDLLLAIAPKISRIAVLLNPQNPSSAPIYRSVQDAAREIGVTVFDTPAATFSEIEQAFATMARQHAQGFVLISDPFLVQARTQIVRLTAKAKLPAVFPLREYAQAGGLVSYGTIRADTYRRAAVFVDKILKGANPSELPVELPTSFNLVLNLKTAKALGLTIPKELLLRADEVME